MSTIILTYVSTLNLSELESLESIETAAGGIAPWAPRLQAALARQLAAAPPTAALQHIFIVCSVSAWVLQQGLCSAARGVCSHSSLSGNSCEPSHQALIMRLYLHNVNPVSW